MCFGIGHGVVFRVGTSNRTSSVEQFEEVSTEELKNNSDELLGDEAALNNKQLNRGSSSVSSRLTLVIPLDIASASVVFIFFLASSDIKRKALCGIFGEVCGVRFGEVKVLGGSPTYQPAPWLPPFRASVYSYCNST